jgi:cupin 2 domain-containing protein
MTMKNLFDTPNPKLPQEQIEKIAEGSGCRVERILSTGHSSPPNFWYDQNEDEWVCIVQGQAVLEFDNGELLQLGPGDHYFIPAHQRHRVKSTSHREPTIWLAVFFCSKSPASLRS